MKKKISAILSVVLILSLFAGCSSSSSQNMSASYSSEQRAGGTGMRNAAPMAAPAAPAPAAAAPEMVAKDTADGFAMESAMPEMEPESPDTGGGVAGPTVNSPIDTRKIIRNVDMQLQTQSFDASVGQIPAIVESFGGYIESSYVEGRDMYNERGARHASFTARIPSERLDSFTDSVGGEFHVTSKSQNSQDITESYYDSKARLDALKIQEERLLEMLKQAAELEYLLQVEKELMNVRYEIESLTSSLSRMDSYVSMSTVNLSLNEVVKYDPIEDVPVSFGERISHAFADSWKNFGEFTQNFAVGFVAVLPFLIIDIVVLIVIIIVVRKIIRRIKSRKAKASDAASPLEETVSDPADPAPEEKEEEKP